MIAVIKATSPEGVSTRLVFGCAEPAQMTGRALYECGFQVEGDMVEAAPERTPDEMKRAQDLVALVFANQGGHA
jgi:hypothetical protein